jgi:hypothetical protein
MDRLYLLNVQVEDCQSHLRRVSWVRVKVVIPLTSFDTPFLSSHALWCDHPPLQNTVPFHCHCDVITPLYRILSNSIVVTSSILVPIFWFLPQSLCVTCSFLIRYSETYDVIWKEDLQHLTVRESWPNDVEVLIFLSPPGPTVYYEETKQELKRILVIWVSM